MFDKSYEIVTIFVPSNTNQGYTYTHTGESGLYRLEIYSPTDLPTDDYFPNYVWTAWNLPPPGWTTQHWKGGQVCVLKNKYPIWSRGAGGYHITNYDYLFPPYKGTEGSYHDGRKEAADLARGSYYDIELEAGDYIRLIAFDNRYNYGDNHGGITFKLFVYENDTGL